MLYSSGHDTVDQMAEWNPQGLVIPYTWFQTIQKSDKPYMPAIVILAEIVYWYRPSIIRDEVTGRVLGYKKKFKADMLQKNRSGFADTFGLTKNQVYTGIDHLKELGVIKNHLRDEVIYGQRCNNVPYIELNYEVLRELTYPMVTKVEPEPESMQDGVAETEEKVIEKLPSLSKSEGSLIKKRGGSLIKKRGLADENATNTKITYTKTTVKDKENSPKRKKRVYELDSLEMRMTLKFESLIQEKDEKFKVSNPTAWCDQFRLMMEKDERTPEEIHTAMIFAQTDSFWQSNVLSAEKLRKQMTTLLIQHKQKESGRNAKTNFSAMKETAKAQLPGWLEDEAEKQRAYDKRKAEELNANVPDDVEIHKLFEELQSQP